MTEQTDGLKACPFCGSSDLGMNAAPSTYVQCGQCLADGPYNDVGDEAAAIAAWNKRATRPSTAQAGAGVREALRLLMIKQPITESRDTYSDGFAIGLCTAIEHIDTALASQPTQPAQAGEAVDAGQFARSCIQAANDGYHRRDDYPRFAVTPWDDRLRWSDYVQKIIAEQFAALQTPVSGEGKVERLRTVIREYAGVHGVLTEDDRAKLRAALNETAS